MLLRTSSWALRRWDGSTQAWRERGSALGLVAGACILWLLSDTALPISIQLLLWLGWLGALVLLQHTGRLPLFGPVLFYDMVRTARRNRYVLMRTLYAVFLLLLLLWVYSLVGSARLDQRAQEARLAQSFFETLMIVQLIVVVVLMPAYMGGAIADEKERRTLEFILATDLRNQEVILGKLGSRLANLALFLLTGLPILSFLQFLGGIDPNLVLMGFAVTGFTMLGIGSVSLLYSVLMRRARDAIGASYLCLLAYAIVAAALWAIHGTVGWHYMLSDWFEPPLLTWLIDAADGLTEALNAGSPLVLAIRVAQSARAGSLALSLPGLLRDYATFHLILAVLCLSLATLRLRTVGLRQTLDRASKTSRRRTPQRPIGARPMLWKELLENRHAIGRAAWAGLIVLGVLTLGGGVWIWIHNLRTPRGNLMYLVESMNVWARLTGVPVACLGLLRAAIRASAAVSGERDQQTLDALITTQLDSDSVLAAKLLGSVLSVRPALFWLGAILLLGCLTGGVHAGALVLTLASWIVYAFCFAVLGLLCSLRCASSSRAAVAAVLLSIGLAAGHWLIWICLGPLLLVARSPSSFVDFLAKLEYAMSPPAILAVFMFPSQERFTSSNYHELLGYGMFGVVVWGLAAAVCWFGLLSPLFRATMRRTPIQ